MRVRATITALAATLILTSCNVLPGQRPAGGAATGTSAALSAWLLPGAKLSSEIRLVTDGSEDLLQAGYLTRPGMEPQCAVLLRDFRDRAPGRLDSSRIALLDYSAAALNDIDTGNIRPQRLALGSSSSSFVWAGASMEAESAAIKSVQLFRWEPESLNAAPAEAEGQAAAETAQLTPIASDLWPLRLDGAGNVIAIPMQGRSVVDGILLPWLRLDSEGVLLDRLTSQAGVLQTGSLPNSDGSLMAGFSTSVDPASPANAAAQYRIYRKGRPVGRWNSNFFIAPANASWLPGLQWVDNDSLAWLGYRPQQPGQMDAAAGTGLFRLVCTDALEARHTLIEDHVGPDFQFIARGGAIFYCLPAPSGSGQSWDLWAAGPDGLSKQRLWHWADASYVQVEDMLGDRRLLVSRMFVDSSGSEPRVICELREVSLDPLSAGFVKLGIDPLVKVEAAPDGGADASQAEEKAPEDAGPLGGNDGPGSGSEDLGPGFIPDNPSPVDPAPPSDPGLPGQPPPIGNPDD